MAERADEGRIRVGVLGPTIIDGVAVTSRQRSILAALALHSGRSVPTADLVDAVWSGEGPPSARQSLQNQITRLRRRFGSDLIETGPSGYRLLAPTDAEVFERSVGPWTDRAASPEGVEVLDAAVGLWRGTPYTDLEDLYEVEPERARLESLHSHTVEQLAVCRMVAGDIRRATTDLHALAGLDPYREQRWLLLMLGLYLDGRRTDALAQYDLAAAIVGRDLGVRPSETLAALRSAIERNDPVDVADWAPVDTTAGTTPCGANRRHRGRCTTRGGHLLR